MNSLLPKIDDLEPIVDSRQTFSETPFIRDFYKLDDAEKLQILADIVRQTMIYEKIPNPLIEKKLLIGDDYTSSKIFIDYLKSLNLFDDTQLVLVSNRKNIDINNFYDCHFSVLVNGINNKTYLVDTTPDIGYGFGEVNELSNRDLYNKYIVLDSNIINIIDIIRDDMYDISKGIYNDKQIDNYKIIRKFFSNEVFDGLLLKYYNCVFLSNFDKLKTIMKIDFHDRVDNINSTYLQNELYKIKTIKTWQELLKKMTIESSNLMEQQRIAQYICGESKLSRTIEINGNVIKLNHITPRLLWENGYNVVVIKSSAYLMGIQASCEDYVISKRKDIISSYMCNMGEKNMFGLRPMAYFHPHGLKYEFQMNGPNKVILVSENAKELNERKHYIRDNMTRIIQNHFINWFNGEKVLWDTNLNTNLVHTTDDSVEACIHLLSGYPEYQSFTRFNYPNPVLRKEKRK